MPGLIKHLVIFIFLIVCFSLLAPRVLAQITPPSCSGSLQRYDACENTYTYATTGLANPWQQSDGTPYITATFTTPSQKTLNIDGFYDDVNTYKVRFTPAEVGKYTYSVTLSGGPDGTKSYSGSFTANSVTTRNNGFIRKNPANPYRFITEGDSMPFNGIGFNDCWGAGSGGVYDLSNFIDASVRVPVDTYFSTYAASGMNLFRWDNGNCSFSAYRVGTNSVVYDLNGSKSADFLLQTAKKYGFHVQFAFFLTPAANLEPALSPGEKLAIKYAVARYSAYTDLWEMTNETSPNNVADSWMQDFRNYLHNLDPYQRLITNSHPRDPGQNNVGDWTILDYRSPHTSVFDGWSLSNSQTKSFTTNEGILVGEGYNSTGLKNWSYLTDSYLRIAHWTGFLSGLAVTYWNTSYCQGCSTINMYLGRGERAVVKVLQDVVKSFSAGLTGNLSIPHKLNVTNNATGYDVAAGNKLMIYLYRYTNLALPPSPATINSYSLPFSGTGVWVDPANGNVVQTVNFTSGVQNITSPSFWVDMALVVTSNLYSCGLSCGSGQSCNFSGTACQDSQPPTAPANLKATPISYSQINLSWTASTDNVGVSSYDIFRNNTKIGEATINSFSDGGLIPGTNYSYFVIAHDAMGNTSRISNTANATTSTRSSMSSLYCISGDASFCSPPIGEWRLEENTGTTAKDSSGNGKEMTITPGAGGWTTGKIGNAYNFVASPGTSVISNNNYNAPSQITFEAWVYDRVAGPRIFQINEGADVDFRLIPAGKIFFNYLWTGGSCSATTTNTFGLNAWHHVAVTYDSTAASNVPLIYVDAAPVATTTSCGVSGIPVQRSGSWTIGANGFDGIIDEVRVYDYVRTPNQISYDTTLVPSSPAPSGDLNGDGKINGADLLILLQNYLTNSPAADLNKDGIVNLIDGEILINNIH